MDYLKNFGWDKDNGGWYTSTDENNEPDTTEKNLFDEVYCCLGPTLYYFVTGDKDSLSYVQKTHTLMQTKAWDREYSGYFARVGRKWENITSSKSFNAEIDTCTAYLIYYYLATKNPDLLNDLKSITDVVGKRMVDPKTGFVGEKYSKEWVSQEPMLWAGHNLKTGWVMMRMYYLTSDKKYLETAEKIAVAQVKYTWDGKYGGWFFQFSGNDPSSVNEAKDWWTQEEGDNLMLNLFHYTANKSYLNKFQKSASFWDNHFIDKQYGECFSTLSRDGEPTNRTKSNLFKSAYHTMEHALFNYLYLSLYVNRQDAALYFNLSADTAGEKHYVNLLEDPAVIIRSVEIDGKEWKDFNSREGYVTLPQGKNMKVKVDFGVK
jgi:mannobiose 2-epimerase